MGRFINKYHRWMASRAQKLHTVRLSFLFLVAVLVVSFVPVVGLVAMWLVTWYTGNHNPWVFQMMNQCTEIIDHIWSAQLIAGVMAYGAALVDSNGDGIPDEFEKGEKVSEAITTAKSVVNEVTEKIGE